MKGKKKLNILELINYLKKKNSSIKRLIIK